MQPEGQVIQVIDQRNALADVLERLLRTHEDLATAYSTAEQQAVRREAKALLEELGFVEELGFEPGGNA